MTVKLFPCENFAPYALVKKNKYDRATITEVRCNRPLGHEGPHAYSTTTCVRWLQWHQDGTYMSHDHRYIQMDEPPKRST